MLSSMLCIACYASTLSQYEGSKYLPPLYLVRTTTVRVWREKNEYFDRGRIRITKVVAGPERLIKCEFEATTESPYQLGSTFGRKKYPNTFIWLLKEGAEGLWWVNEEGNDQTLRPVVEGAAVHLFGLNTFPYQKTKTKPFFGEPESPLKQGVLWQEGEEFAKAVAEVYAAKSDDDRRVLLERYAATEESPIATWAIALLARGPRAPTIKFLRDLVKKDKLDAPSQMMLDELLCRFDTKKWAGSPERKELLTRWLDPRAKDILFLEACYRLQSAESDDLDVELFVEVVSQAVASADQMKESKQIDLVHVLRFSARWFGDTEKEKEKARAFLERMRSLSKSELLKEQIGFTIKHLK